ncbi:MAG: adenine-specific DNA-methyltransferase [Proteiniphilum sp.]|jgi:adenine-specific DNA-methyltransferase|nr:adenine-specific DNA-methyltransferase [Proteiniphilum sp.]
MEKLTQETVNFTEKNIDRIAALFPSAITETKDADGKLKRAVNFDQLKQLLSDEMVDGDECYEFTWVGKKQSIIEGNRPIRKTLRPSKEESKNWETTENLYIEGDNLDVLKLLQNSYLNKVKMIYIDPPYNTGNDFVYRDNFKVSKEDYEEELGLFDEEENRLFKNTETNGRYHSDWCSMMYPRLQLARNLLIDDGVIFISIDDNEVHNLRKICDEVFGEENFVAEFVWVKKKKGSHLSKTTRNMTEYVLCFSKNKNSIELYGEKAYSDKQQPLAKRTNSQKTLFFNSHVINTTLQDGVYEGKYGEGSSSLLFKKFEVKNNKVISGLSVNGPFVWTQAKLDAEVKKGTIINLSSKFGFNVLRSDQTDKIKRPSTLIDNKVKVGTNEDAYNESIQLFKNEGIMNYPKPVSLITFLINSITYFDKDAIILDFFSGSATTAHAVMQLNAEDGGNRKFIMVQLPEETEPNSEAYKAGYRNICEIGKERIRRAGKKIEEELKEKSKEGELFQDEERRTPDTGFRVLKVDSTNMKDVFYSPSQYNQQMLLELESNIKDDRTDIDLLYGVLLDWGVPLSLPHITEKIGGKDVHFVNETDLVACFEEQVPEEVIREIARRKPLRVVFRDSSFRNSPDKINVTEIFKTLSPETTIKVI